MSIAVATDAALPLPLSAQIRAMREQGASFSRIAAALNQVGARGPNGGRWFPATVRRTLLDAARLSNIPRS